jgi:hypothetical protein
MTFVTAERSILRVILAVAPVCASVYAGQTWSAELNWPAPYIATDARLSSVGDHISINGIPALIYRYTTERKPDEVVEYFRVHVERDFSRAQPSAALPGQIAVAGRVGDFWVTLQLRQQAGQTVGTWSAVPQFMADIRGVVQRPAGFPQSAQLIQQIDSFDAGKRSQMAIGLDPSPVDGVAARLADELLNQGFARQPTPQRTWPSPSTYVAIFRKDREEIFVTLAQESAGTSVMINRISALEELQ